MSRVEIMEGRKKQNNSAGKNKQTRWKLLYRTECPCANTAGITTQMARMFLPGVQDLVGSCKAE